MRIFLLLLSSRLVFSNLFSISSGSKSGKSRRLVPSDGASSSCRLSGLSESGKGEFSCFIACTLGGWMEEAAAILKGSVESVELSGDSGRWASVFLWLPSTADLTERYRSHRPGSYSVWYSWRPPLSKKRIVKIVQ